MTAPDTPTTPEEELLEFLRQIRAADACDTLTLQSCDVTHADLGPGIVERLPEAYTPTTPEERLLEFLRGIRASLAPSPVEGVGPRTAPLVAEFTILLCAAMDLASAVADSAVEDSAPLPSPVVAWNNASLNSIASSLRLANYARSEALPGPQRREIARALPAPGGRP